MTSTSTPRDVAILMGSKSDWPVMRGAAEKLAALDIGYDARVISAHRNPEKLRDFAMGASKAGFKVIIAGAGGAAHLPGVTASMTLLPVLGVPIAGKVLDGQDALYSIVQMPSGIPVGCLGIGAAGAANAALLAAAILALEDKALAARLQDWRQTMSNAAQHKLTDLP